MLVYIVLEHVDYEGDEIKGVHQNLKKAFAQARKEIHTNRPNCSGVQYSVTVYETRCPTESVADYSEKDIMKGK